MNSNKKMNIIIGVIVLIILGIIIYLIFGSGKMLIESGLDDTVLRKNVTSPGGTTEKAMEEFLNSDFKQVVFSAIEKAKQRAEEL